MIFIKLFRFASFDKIFILENTRRDTIEPRHSRIVTKNDQPEERIVINHDISTNSDKENNNNKQVEQIQSKPKKVK